MIEKLIALALRFRVAVIAITLLLVGVGVWALGNLNVDAFPDLTPNQVQVITVAPGLSPNDVENLVSYPMETAMMGLPRTRGVRSISKAGISVVTVSYDDDVDMYFARAQVTQRMQDAAGNLPAGNADERGVPVSGRVGQPVAHGAEERPGVHRQADAPHDSRCRGREFLGRHGAAVSRPGRPLQARGLQPDAPRPRASARGEQRELRC